MKISLSQKVVWITGGAAGLGLAIATLCAECGAHVVVSDIDEEALKRVDEIIRGPEIDIMTVPADVSDDVSMAHAVDRLIERFGRLDCVFANAGTNGTWAPIEKLTPSEWQSTIAVNLTGTYLAAHYAVPHLKKRGGSFVIISSVNGTRVFSNEGATAYATSKAAQLAFGKMLALELAQFHVRVNVICPGSVDTGIHEKTKKRDLQEIDIPVEFPDGTIPLTHSMARPEQVAQLAVFLSSDMASHITGTPVWIDGAESLLQG
jgi:NAD(P)-dependent dehydrogenase (short-subunit alcohol dehydrogenase family)